jgi:hypothetical protein
MRVELTVGMRIKKKFVSTSLAFGLRKEKLGNGIARNETVVQPEKKIVVLFKN